jgi:hypothetical protein
MAKRPKRYVTKALKAKIMAEAAREFGLIGGLRRTAVLTPEERRRIATKASKAAAKARSRRAAERKAKGRKSGQQ